MSLRHAILGVVKDKPMTGYELVRHFQDTIGRFWSAPQSQIYPELRKMEAAGLVHATVAPRGQRGKKRIYSITEKGMAELRRWAADVLPLPPERDVVILKAAFFDLAPLDAVREQLRSYIAQYQRRMEGWEERLHAIQSRRAVLLEKWLERQPPEEHEITLSIKIYALEGLIARARTEIEWAQRGLALCDRIEALRAARQTWHEGDRAREPVEGDDGSVVDGEASGSARPAALPSSSLRRPRR